MQGQEKMDVPGQAEKMCTHSVFLFYSGPQWIGWMKLTCIGKGDLFLLKFKC